MHLSVNDGIRPELCLTVKHGRSTGASAHPEFPIFLDYRMRMMLFSGYEIGKQNPAVFIDVCEIFQNPQNCFLEVLPQMVGLQRLDFCNSVGIDTEKPIALTQSLFEGFVVTANREHIVFSGCILRGKHQFPHKVIKRGSEVLKTITNDQAESGGNFLFSDKCERAVIRGAIWLSHQFARIALKVPLKFGFKALQVKCSPEDFQFNRIE